MAVRIYSMAGLAQILSCSILAAACGDGGAARPDASAPIIDAGLPDAIPTLFPRLHDTGLYAGVDGETLAAGVRAYEPAFELWSDGARKERWVQLPEGETIDTTNMDFWRYPVGTKLWKEFVRDGVRVETRLLYKMGPGARDWYMMGYVWNAAQTEAVAAPRGAVDVLGTGHDVPDTDDCEKCHQRMPDIAIGFSAILLDHDRGGVTLADLASEGRLSQNPTGAAPYFPLPGDATARAALGYLHTNCGNCHHAESTVQDHTPVILRLDVATLGAVEQTRVYATTVGVEPELGASDEITALIEPGMPEASGVHARMMSREFRKGMPPVGSEIVDEDGVAIVDAWIRALAP